MKLITIILTAFIGLLLGASTPASSNNLILATQWKRRYL